MEGNPAICGYSWQKAAYSAVFLPSCPSPGRPSGNISSPPAPSRGHRPRDQLFQQLLKSRSKPMVTALQHFAPFFLFGKPSSNSPLTLGSVQQPELGEVWKTLPGPKKKELLPSATAMERPGEHCAK